MPQTLIILYDGHCPLCHGLVRWLLRRDRGGQLLFASLQGPTGRGTLEGWKGAVPDSIVVLSASGALVKSRAVMMVLDSLPGPWPLLARLGCWVPRALADLLYDFVAKIRYSVFGRFESCPVTDPRWKDRFLD